MSDELKPCPKCGGTKRRATVGDVVRLVDVWCPDCKTLIDYGPIEGVLAENDDLRAKWESVPWGAMESAIWCMASYLPESKWADYDALVEWFQANGPAGVK